MSVVLLKSFQALPAAICLQGLSNQPGGLFIFRSEVAISASYNGVWLPDPCIPRSTNTATVLPRCSRWLSIVIVDVFEASPSRQSYLEIGRLGKAPISMRRH